MFNTIEPGLDFIKVLNERVATCEIMLVVIGRDWLTTLDARGRKRIDDPNDFVHLEVKAALDRDIRVVPVLIDDAALPLMEELPEGLKPLARRQVVRISNDRFGADTGGLIELLRKLVMPASVISGPAKKSAGLFGGMLSGSSERVALVPPKPVAAPPKAVPAAPVKVEPVKEASTPPSPAPAVTPQPVPPKQANGAAVGLTVIALALACGVGGAMSLQSTFATRTIVGLIHWIRWIVGDRVRYSDTPCDYSGQLALAPLWSLSG